MLAGGEAAKAAHRIVYPVSRAELKASDWWHDAPARALGAHDGLPDRLRRR